SDFSLEPLFVSKSGPLSFYAVLQFDPRGPLKNDHWLEALHNSSLVLRVQPDHKLDLAALPNDPHLTGEGKLSRQFHILNPEGVTHRTTRAWPFVPRDEEVIVAMIDSGVDWNHPDLGGDTPPGGVMWINDAEANGVEGVDDDENGFVDDWIGWDFVDATSLGTPVAQFEDGSDPDNDPRDFGGHGTEVAGLIHAISDNGEGLAGHPANIKLMPLRVGWQEPGGRQVVYMGYAAQALEYASLHGARVANCSWDSLDLIGLGAALDMAINEYDMVICGSAGNNGVTNPSLQYLAMREDCLGVAAIREDGSKAGFSNFGDWVSIAAFGVGMATTGYEWVTEESQIVVNPGGGTSFSAPIVAGHAALLRAIAPEATASEIRNAIVSTGFDLGISGLGGGLSDVAAASQALGGGWERLCGASDAHALGETLFYLEGGTPRLASGATAPAEVCKGETSVPSALPLVSTSNAVTLITSETEGQLRDASGGSLGSVALASPPKFALAGDFLGDGTQRFAIGDGSNVLLVLEDGSSTATELAGDFALADFVNEDAALDLITLDSGGALTAYDFKNDKILWTSSSNTIHAVNPVTVIRASGKAETFLLTTGIVPSVNLLSLRSGQIVDGFPRNLPGVGTPQSLSVAGFGVSGNAALVLAEANGDIHLLQLDGQLRGSVSAGSPIMGEVLCADIDGDSNADLIAATEDGSLWAWSEDLEVLAGFPRAFPASLAGAPIIMDSDSKRFVVLTDTEGSIWSIPAGLAGTPAPWPVERANAARSGTVFEDSITPVAFASLEFRSQTGLACWRVTGDAPWQQLRIRNRDHVFWSQSFSSEGCASARVDHGERLVLEGLAREGGWQFLAETNLGLPGSGLLLQPPFPNPFASEMRVSFSLPEKGGVLEIFDVRGRRVLRWDAPQGTGTWTWDGSDLEGRTVPSGVYWLRLRSGEEQSLSRILKIN
ncbi:MAG: S8 family serine peptidase, partial [Candidatus Eisenbacteria bacterium]|nr:S8 family serine peptidase [Candidatus Eisenbacteria bacterium]